VISKARYSDGGFVSLGCVAALSLDLTRQMSTFSTALAQTFGACGRDLPADSTPVVGSSFSIASGLHRRDLDQTYMVSLRGRRRAVYGSWVPRGQAKPTPKTKDLLAPKSAIQLVCKENKTTRAIAVWEGFGRWPRRNSLARIFVHRRPTAIRCRSCFCVMP